MLSTARSCGAQASVLRSCGHITLQLRTSILSDVSSAATAAVAAASVECMLCTNARRGGGFVCSEVVRIIARTEVADDGMRQPACAHSLNNSASACLVFAPGACHAAS